MPSRFDADYRDPAIAWDLLIDEVFGELKSSFIEMPRGEGFIDYPAFFKALQETGFAGHVAYEMCSPLRGGGSEENLDRCARKFLSYMAQF